MVEAVCHAAKVLGWTEEVMSNVLRLIESVEEAAHGDKIELMASTPHVNQAELLDSLIEEYCDKM